MAQVSVGGNVDSWCARCKLMLAHTIEAIVKDKITRVHCNTCGGQHAYKRNPPGTAAARKRGATGSRTGKEAPPVFDYQALMRGKDVASARPYKMSERFQTKDVIRHPTFGVGIVLAVRDASKIDVGFPEGLKTLAQGAAA